MKIRFRSFGGLILTCASTLVAVGPVIAAPVTFAQYFQVNGAQQQWTISTSGNRTTVTVTGPVIFLFSGVPGLPFGGPENATFTLSATSTSLGSCGVVCGAGDSFSQQGYSGTFSYTDTGSAPGTNLLSGTFTVTGSPSTTGAQFSSAIGSTGASFNASSTAGNLGQLVLASAYLNFAAQINETSSWSLSSFIPAFATGPVTGGDNAYPVPVLPATAFHAAGSGTFSSNPAPTSIVSPPAAGAIRIVKNTVGGNGTFAFTTNFGLTSLTTVGGTASQTFGGLTAGGSYSVSETVASGWTQTGAVCTNGTPAAITVVSGATTTCTFTNTIAPATGSIRVVKNTVGGNGTFAFTSNFGLTSLSTVGGTAGQTFGGLTAGGSYTVSETVPSGWTQTGAVCTNGTPAAITVVSGATTICTFTNTIAPATGSIRVVKNTVGGNGTFAFTSTFGSISLTTVGGTASQTFSGLTAGGSYSVSETVPSGWTQTGAVCTNGTPAAITVVTGATTTCTFTNTVGLAPATGSIRVVKNTVGGNGTFAFTSNFGLASLTTVGGTASQTFSGLTAGGSYSVGETVPSGWTQTGAVCTNGAPAAVIVVAEATTTCTFTNTVVVAFAPDLTILKSHAGDFRQGDTGDTYTVTVTNAGQGATTGMVTVTDTLPAGLTATGIGGNGWTCMVGGLTCTRSDSLAAGASYPSITVTVSVASNSLAFVQVAGSLVFREGDILVSLADGTVQWRRRDWGLVKVLPSITDGEAKGMAFDRSGSLYVTHWYGTGNSGNDVATFSQNGSGTGLFGSNFDCNPSSIVFDNAGNAYVGQADCSTRILKLDSSGKTVAQYSVAVENRGTYDIILDNNQCTMYYTSEGPNVKRFDVCTNTQMSNFNSAPLPDPAGGSYSLTMLPDGGMLIADFSVIARLDASGNFVRSYDAPGNDCWLGVALDSDTTSFWASDWCGSSVTRFDIATGNVMESQVATSHGYMIKKILIPGSIFKATVTNTASVAGGGELNTSNNSASDVTTINPPAQPAPASIPDGTVNSATYMPTVAAGSIASVFGTNLAAGQAFASTIPLPTTLASGSFQIGGRGAPLFVALPTQVNLQIPWEVAGQTQATITATVGGKSSTPQLVTIAPFAPGIFTISQAGSSQGVVVIAGTQVLAAPANGANRRPVSAGEYISIYCTGLGAVSNQPATGTAAPADLLSETTTLPSVTIGGIAARVSFSGLTPGAVGLYQVNVQVPSGLTGGPAVPLLLRIGGGVSNTVVIAVQ